MQVVQQVAGKLREQMKAKQKELTEFQSKYKIRIRNEADIQEEQEKQEAEASQKKQGVLA